MYFRTLFPSKNASIYFVQDCSTYRQPKSSAIFLHRVRGIEFHFNCLLQLHRGTMLFEHKNLVRLSLQSLGFGRGSRLKCQELRVKCGGSIKEKK